MADIPGRLIVWVSLGLALGFPGVGAGTESINFTHLRLEDGIPVGGVTAVGQDLRGFVWFGTEDGLRKYDGYEMVSYRRELGAGGFIRLRENTINALTIDRENRIWFGTDDGLRMLNPDVGERRHFDPAGKAASPGARVVTAIARSPGGTVWLGSPGGLYELEAGKHTPKRIAGHISVTSLYWDKKTSQVYVGTRRGEILRAEAGTGDLESVSTVTSAVTGILRDYEGAVWVATRGEGVVCLRDGLDPLRYNFRAGQPGSLSSNDVGCLLEDSERQIWVGTRNGLNRFNRASGDFERYENDPDDPRTLPTNDIRCLFEDQRHVLWVGHSRGVSRFPLSQRSFVHHRHRLGDPASLGNDSVFGMLVDSKGRLWVGTEDGLGLLQRNGRFRHYRFTAPDNGSPSANFVYVICEAPDGDLWLGTRGNGLLRFDPDLGELEVLEDDAVFLGGVSHGTITALAADEDGRLWVGSEEGIVLVERYGGITHFEHDPGDSGSLASNAITDILVTRSGRVFVATANAGVQVYDEEGETFRSLEKLSSEKIVSLFEDKAGQIWVGTSGSGVHAYDPKWKRVLHYHHGNSALPGNSVFGILQDQTGHMWFSTDNGLARMNVKEEKIRVFDSDDGLQAMIFHPKAFCSDELGRLYFGGANGFNVIDPDGLPKARVAHQAVLTGLEMNGERVKAAPDNPYLQRPLGLTKELKLSFDQSQRLAFTFATLDYTVPAGGRFRYRMVPMESSWTDAGKDRKAIYTGLPAGRYRFEVQASLDGELWNMNSAQIPVRVFPPWYLTWWAMVCFAALAIGFIAGVAYYFLRRHAVKVRRQKEMLENDRNRAEAALASQLQRAMLVQRTTYELQKGDDDSVFAATLDRLNSYFGANVCILCEYFEEPTATLNVLEERYDGMSPTFSLEGISPDNRVITEVLSKREPVVAVDVSEDDIFETERATLLSEGIRGVLAIKTSHLGTPNGVLFLLHREPREWAEEDLRLIETVGDQIGVNIAHHRLTLADEEQKAELALAREIADVANQAKSDFLAKMTHEVRTPLGAILGFSEMLAQDVSVSAEQRATLDIINSSGEHLLQTVNDILDMSKIEAGKIELTKEEFDLREVLSSVKGMLAERAKSKGLALDLKCSDDLPTWIMSDKMKLRQILVNLVGNAIKFTDKGGITITAARESYNSGISANDKGIPRRLYFEVIDTGSGISEAEVSSLFEKFTQTGSGRRSGQGTGLGLAISKSFVELMGGAIAVRSDLGVGTVFSFDIHCIELPAEVAEKKESFTSGMRKLATGQEAIRVLVAEDQLPNRMLLKTLLEKAGFQVFEAANGKEAVEGWKSFDPQIIFMDNEMPEMNGMDATREILRQAEEDPPAIVACTAYALESYRKEAFDAGCVDFLAKPYQQEQLFELIGRHLPVEYAWAGA